jgi:hypothetical protein
LGATFFNAIAFIKGSFDLFPALGNIIAAFGSQEWFAKAVRGETTTPIGVRLGVVNANEFVANCKDLRK